jgi:hypothetical protein
MTSPETSQEFESYVPVYDAVPEKWEDARPMLVEQLKKISTAVNSREIGFLLDEELLSGKSFIPGGGTSGGSNQFRTVFRKVIDVSPLSAGLNAGVNHGITFDTNFTLIDLWVAGTDSGSLTARDISGNDVIMNSTQIVITSPQSFDRAFAFVEYIQEL